MQFIITWKTENGYILNAPLGIGFPIRYMLRTHDPRDGVCTNFTPVYHPQPKYALPQSKHIARSKRPLQERVSSIEQSKHMICTLPRENRAHMSIMVNTFRAEGFPLQYMFSETP